MKSPGVIFDPYVAPAGAPSLFSSAGIQLKARQWKNFLGSGIAAKKIGEKFPEFKPNQFGAEAGAIFEEVNALYQGKNIIKLKHSLTGPLYDAVSEGHRKNWALANHDDLAFELVGVEDGANVVQMRVFNISRDMPDVAFAQVTVRIPSIQRVASGRKQPKRPPPTGTGSGGSSSSSSSDKKTAVAAEGGSGSWLELEPQLLAPDEAARWHSLGEQEDTNDAAAGNTTDGEPARQAEQAEQAALYRLVNHCVLERPLFIPDSQWKICKL
eukprot:g4661.t1